MKRNVLILFFIIGFTALEYGCKHEPLSTDKCDRKTHMSVTGILQDASLLQVDNGILLEVDSGGEVNYSKLVIRFYGKPELISNNSTYSNFSAYARVAPSFPVCWDLRRIRVEGVSANGTQDLTSLFSLCDNYVGIGSVPITNDEAFRNAVLQMVVGTPVVLHLTMHQAPEVQQEMTIRVKFENTDGRIFEFTTAAFTITP